MGSGEWRDVSTLMRDPVVDAGVENVSFDITIVQATGAGRSWTIRADRPGRVLLGKSPACEIHIEDPWVSRRHGALELFGNTLRYDDLDSANGSFVNDVQVGEAFLHGTEHIRIGETVLRIEAAVSQSRAQLTAQIAFGDVVGASPEMRRIYPLCERLAASAVPMMIEGETGTGKEVLAESIHRAGPRRDGPFVVFDCTTVSPNLVESTLFGHERGAFTGAVERHTGVFEEAHGGTLFIDEIGDLDAALQPKLLRAIERSEVLRVGGRKWTRVDVRVISATRRDIEREIQAGRFRDDLFYRLAVARVELPPLRRRGGDVALLTRHFWRKLVGSASSPPQDLVRRFEDYNWPGNVRELYNRISQYVALGETHFTESPRASEEDLDPVSWVLSQDLPLTIARQRLVEEFERRYVERVVDRYAGNITQAALASGLARRYFQILKNRVTR